ncbi:unnamed protein product [Penicillium palitans]
MRFSTALISTLVLPRIALASPVAQVSSSVGAGATTEVEADISTAESSSNDKEKTSVDTASAAKKHTHSATTSANAEASVKPDTSGLDNILSTESSSLRSTASETMSHVS